MTTEPTDDDDVLDRFPAFARITAGNDEPIPYVAQLTATECGAACLAMVLAMHGKSVPLDELREATGANRDGTNAATILAAARAYGLQGRGVQLDVEELGKLDGAGAILHWNFDHFVVLQRVRKSGIEIVDPANGPRSVTWEAVRRSFTGVALLLEPSIDFTPTPPHASPIWAYAKSLLRRTKLLPRILWMSVLVQLFALAVPLLTGSVVDEVIPRNDPQLLTVLLLACAAVVLFQFLASLVRGHLMLHLRSALDARMTLGFFEHLVDLPYQFFQLRSSGDLLMRLNSNSSIREVLTNGALSALLDGTLVCFYLVALLLFSPPLAGLVLLLALVEVAFFFVTRRARKELAMRGIEAQARSRNQQIQILQGIETLKALGGEQRAVAGWSNLFVDELNASLASGRLDAYVGAVFSSLKLLGPVAVLGFGAWQVMRGALSLGEMLALNAIAVGFLGPLSTLISNATQLQLLESYVQRLEDVFKTPREESGPAKTTPRLAGAVELRDVSFSYGAAAPEVIRGVSARIERGQHVAIVGRSGAGKSTLAGLLIGLYRPQSGQIRFDDIELGELSLRGVRGQIGVVTQQSFVFGATIRDNIVLGRPELDLQDVARAARLAGIADYIERLPMGYDTILADGGASLSGGQRQRIALARAVIGQPAILLLDEATSALDMMTERDVQAALEKLRCTRIVIAHRLSTVVSADVIFVLDDGRLVERGTHDELLGRGGEYARLVAAQLETRRD